MSYAFDALGNRIERQQTVGGVTATEHFAYDGGDVWADLDGSNAVTARRVFGDGADEVLARLDAGGAVAWYGTDRMGSVRTVFDNSGSVIASSDFDAFGGLIAGSLSDRYGYTGREHDAVTGQRYHRARVADGHRWTTEDPIRDDEANLYRYVGNEPTAYTDPSGLQGACPEEPRVFELRTGPPLELKFPPQPQAKVDPKSGLLPGGSGQQQGLQSVAGGLAALPNATGGNAQNNPGATPKGGTREENSAGGLPGRLGTGNKDELQAMLDALQFGLDILGMIPGYGVPFDLLNGVISISRGDYVGGVLGFAAAVPFLGWFATIAKWGRRVDKAVDAAKKAKKLAEAAEKARELAKAAEKAKEAEKLAEKAKEAAKVAPAPKPIAPAAEIPKSRQRNGKRREYMGQNPNKSSTTYRDVVERMRQEGKIVGEGDAAMVKASDGSWIPLKDAELAHQKDAVKWWNEEGKYWGPKHDKVREFMTDPKNYVLDKPGPNRSAGAKLKETYDPPDPRPGGPPTTQPPGSP